MMNTLIEIKSQAIENRSMYSDEFTNNGGLLTRRSHKIKVLVDALRLVSTDKDISRENLIIPDDCEKYGFVEGKHNLGEFLHFLADMLEE